MSTQPRLNAEQRLNIFAEAVARADGKRRATAEGWHYYNVCPFCKTKGQKAAAHLQRGMACFKCGHHGADEIAAMLAIPIDTTPRQQPAQAPRKPAYWRHNPQAYQDSYLGHFDRLRLWQAYKPLTLESISRYQLGVGVLPASARKHPRLTYARLEAPGPPQGFRGRRIACSCDAKWLTAGDSGVWLWGASLLREGAPVLMVENPIDAILCMQRWPECVAVASTGGAGGWNDDMLAQIAASKPKGVKLCGDNDHAGLPNAETVRYILETVNPQREAAGKLPLKISQRWPQHAATLRRLGVKVSMHAWPAGTAYKYDIGQMIMAEA